MNTQNFWILLVLIYGIFKGSRELIKKKALNYNTGLEILLLYTLTSFAFTIPTIPQAFVLGSWWLYFAVALKSFFVFIAWICGFAALSKMPVGLYGILDLSGVIFSTLFAITIIGERPKLNVFVGMVLVCLGLFLLKFQPKSKLDDKANTKIGVKYIILAFCYTGFNSMSGTMDKLLRRDNLLTSTQLQFWFMFFLSLYYFAYFVIKKIPFNFKSSVKNYRIYIMSVLLVLGDKLLFIANGAGSSVAIMTLLKQVGCIVVIIGGRIFFKEKNTLYKLLCALIVISGIFISTV